jgi:hypothetical protein
MSFIHFFFYIFRSRYVLTDKISMSSIIIDERAKSRTYNFFFIFLFSILNKVTVVAAAPADAHFTSFMIPFLFRFIF